MHLERLDGRKAGQRLSLTNDRSLTIRFHHADGDAGEVAFDRIEQSCLMRVLVGPSLPVNEALEQRRVLHHGDIVGIGRHRFRFQRTADAQSAGSDEGVSTDRWEALRRRGEESRQRVALGEDSEPDLGAAEATTTPAASTSQPRRAGERISASNTDRAPAAARSGFLSRMGKVLRRDRRHKDLDELIDERDMVLMQAGILSLKQHGGLGLPAETMPQVSRGETISITPDAIDRSVFEQWQALHERYRLLECELEHLRVELGLEPDDLPDPVMALAGLDRGRREEVYRHLDELGTENLDGNVEQAEVLALARELAQNAQRPEHPEKAAQEAMQAAQQKLVARRRRRRRRR